LDSIDVNTAMPWQLAVLLDLTRAEVEALLLARPFADAEALRHALPARYAGAQVGVKVPKRDINAGSDMDLVKATGIPLVMARRITSARPFFFMRQLRTLVGEEVFRQVEPLFGAPGFEFVDKLTGQSVKLSADPSRVLISKSESEQFSEVVSRWKLKPVFPQAKATVYEVLSLPETETATDILSELQQSYGRNVIPAYQDERSARRYLNPKYCTVQFGLDVPGQRQQEIISELGLEVEERHRSTGLYTLRIPQAQTDPAALMRTVQALNAQPEVKFAEPNYLAFDDREPLAPPAALPPPTDTEAVPGVPWNLSLVRAPDAWHDGRGSPDTIIAVVDSGIDESHPALQGALLCRGPADDWNFVSDDE